MAVLSILLPRSYVAKFSLRVLLTWTVCAILIHLAGACNRTVMDFVSSLPVDAILPCIGVALISDDLSRKFVRTFESTALAGVVLIVVMTLIGALYGYLLLPRA